MFAVCMCILPGINPNFRTDALKRPCLELLEAFEVLSEQLGTQKVSLILRSEIEFPEWRLTTRAMQEDIILGAAPAAIPGVDGNPHHGVIVICRIRSPFFSRIGVVCTSCCACTLHCQGTTATERRHHVFWDGLGLLWTSFGPLGP